MQVNLKNYIQVFEYSVARQIMMQLGMGWRREDADNLFVFANGGKSSSFVENGSQDEIASLFVDEGIYTEAVLRKNDFETKIGIVLPFYECVDATEFLKVITKKLCPDAKIESTLMIGRGFRQQHFLNQYVRILTEWSKSNPTNPVQFILAQS